MQHPTTQLPRGSGGKLQEGQGYVVNRDVKGKECTHQSKYEDVVVGGGKVDVRTRLW